MVSFYRPLGDREVIESGIFKKYIKNPPLIHDLLRLSEKSDVEVDEEQKTSSTRLPRSTFRHDMRTISWNFTINAQGILPKNGLVPSRSSGHGSNKTT